MSVPNFGCDLIVVGAGMAGLTAAAEAGRQGLSVVVLEKEHSTGGTARGSGGYVWTLPSLEVLNSNAAGGTPALHEVIFEEFPRLVDVMRGIGATVEGPINILTGRGYRVDILGYLDRCTRAIERLGGMLLRDAVVADLVTDSRGAVTGVHAVQAGEGVQIDAPWTILCTGGFVANPTLTSEFLGPRHTPMRVRASRANTGDGLLLARRIGGASARSRGFYGHLVGTGIALDDLSRMRSFGLYHSEHCVLLGRDGTRFVDESRGDHMTVQAEHFVTNPSAALIWDERIQTDIVMQPWISGSPGEDRLEIAARSGARTIRASGFDELARELDGWGFKGSQAVTTLQAFNAAVTSSDASLDPPRRDHRASVDNAPFYVVEVSPAITFPYGGLKVDSAARVTAESGEAVGGLLAAGSDVGGIMGPDYTGGLCTSGSFALRGLSTAQGRLADHDKADSTGAGR
jgi:succinate dehydrogenase/fumarate reductase flavoprotein subunit